MIVEFVKTAIKSLLMRETISKAVVEPVRQNLKEIATSAVSENTLSTVGPYVPVIGSAFGVVKTVVKVYNATSPANAIMVGVKGVLIDCTLPVIKYPVLCAALTSCTAGACITGDANYLVGAFECTKVIIKK